MKLGNHTIRRIPRMIQAILHPARLEPADIQLAIQLGTSWFRQQRLGQLVWYQWQRRGDLPEVLRQDLRLLYYESVASAQLQEHEIQLALRALAANGVRPVVFKGAALAYTVYPDVACRVMDDIDLWIQPGEIELARQTLERLGYHYGDKPDRPAALMVRNNGEIKMFSTRPGGGLVELQRSLFPGEWVNRTTQCDEVSILARIKPLVSAGIPAVGLSPEDGLIQLAIHQAANHQLALAGLRTLFDVTLLARHQPLDWVVVVQRARAWRVATATWLVLSLAVDLCSLTEAADAVHQLAPSPLRRKLIGLFANTEALVNMRDLSQSKWRYVYLLLLVDRKRDAMKLAYRAVWPEDDWLQARYGRSGWRMQLRHLFDAARGRI